jgi:hypothetical protein
MLCALTMEKILINIFEKNKFKTDVICDEVITATHEKK